MRSVMMREDAVCALCAVTLFVERARTVMMVLAIFALGALTFQVIAAEKLRVCKGFPTMRRTSTFSMGFAAFAAT